ncbi:MAG: diaminopimelate epimerase [Candidatus Curtissbacteria bacterium]|nr:diaminopimelate epimerase [Candidatus Curtissbacteria bacterium]
MRIEFVKMQGTGNDMVMIDNRDGTITLSGDQIKKLCDRHFGVGADGLILLEIREGVDCYMNYYNSDGSVGEMCGNGIRCTAAYFKELSGFAGSTLQIGTLAGIKEIVISEDQYSVNMGQAVFESSDFPNSSISIEGFELNFVSTGNPHAVTFVEEVEAVELSAVGPKIENDDRFINRINFEVVQILDEETIKMRVWERGSGITLACGTGACAVFATARKLNKISAEKVKMILPGGELLISENDAGEIIMAGPAKTVFKGEINI